MFIRQRRSSPPVKDSSNEVTPTRDTDSRKKACTDSLPDSATTAAAAAAAAINNEQQWILVGVHATAVLILLLGVVWNHWHLHHHEECDMTYSMYRFRPVLPSIEQDSLQQHYRLFKFVDARDPRHPPSSSFDWCVGTTNSSSSLGAVLFVPGHAGTYQQARSLGAHGWFGPTRKRQRRFHRSDDTLLDVFALDFREEWTALHPAYVTRQAAFVREALRYIQNQCRHYTSYTLVGHSMGGLVAQQVGNDVTAVVTLATPHARPALWGLTSDGQQRHHHHLQHASTTSRLVISGGLRDELIPPETAVDNDDDDDDDSVVVLMGSEIMTDGTVEATETSLLGMDHKAVAWCHNLLVPVRDILVSIHQQQQQQQQEHQHLNLTKVVTETLGRNVSSFADAVRRQHAALQTRYGTLRALAMECAHFHCAYWLVWFYFVIGAWHLPTGKCTGKREKLVLLLPAAVASVLSQHSEHWLSPPILPPYVAIVLALVANALFHVVRQGISRSVAHFSTIESVTSTRVGAGGLLAIVLLYVTLPPAVSIGTTLLWLSLCCCCIMIETQRPVAVVVSTVTWGFPLVTMFLVCDFAVAYQAPNLGVRGNISLLLSVLLVLRLKCTTIDQSSMLYKERHKNNNNNSTFVVVQIVQILKRGLIVTFAAAPYFKTIPFPCHPMACFALLLLVMDLMMMMVHAAKRVV